MPHAETDRLLALTEALRTLEAEWRANADMLAEGNKDEHVDPPVGMQRACADQLALLVAGRTGEPEPTSLPELHNQIMNLPSVPIPSDVDDKSYRIGHRDARHAAAELVLLLQADPVATRPHFLCLACGPTVVDEDGCCKACGADTQDVYPVAPPSAALQAALVELQSASWSRSWRRVKAARKAVQALTGFDVPGPLTDACLPAPPSPETPT